MRYFLDTEFIERRGYLKLISIGISSEDGRDLYHVSTNFDPDEAGGWVKEHVLPKLPPRAHRLTGEDVPWSRAVYFVPCTLSQAEHVDVDAWLSEREIATRIVAFVGDDPDPQFWAYFAAYDWVLFCWLFGTMLDLPKGWPQFCRDLKQSMVERGIRRDQLPLRRERQHDALEDALWLRDAYAVVFPPEPAR